MNIAARRQARTPRRWRGQLAQPPLGLLMLVVAAAGCTSATFKPGASPSTMSAEEALCHDGKPSQAEYNRCMRDKGWFVAGGSNEQRAKPVSPTARGGDAATSTMIDFGDPVATQSGQAIKSAKTAPSVQHVITEPAAQRSPSAVKNDPLALVEVASWWKLGGTARNLDNEAKACELKLGIAHRPDAALTRVTRALGACLRAHGWHGVRK